MGRKTALCEAENGAKMKNLGLGENNAKMRGFATLLINKRLGFLCVYWGALDEKKVYPREKKALVFFHAEPLFEQKQAVLKHKQAPLEAERLQKTYMRVHLLCLVHVHQMIYRLQEDVFPILFCIFIL